jgi:hypothetical protein
MIWENAAKINVGEWSISPQSGALLVGGLVGVRSPGCALNPFLCQRGDVSPLRLTPAAVRRAPGGPQIKEQEMMRSIFAAAAVLLIGTAAAQALELNCSAPRVALGDEPDNNPVVAVEIKYKAEDHAWRIFHHLRNGLVVARNEQYAIQDWTNNHKTQWSGSLNRNRNLVMVGEVRQSADNSTFPIPRVDIRSQQERCAGHANDGAMHDGVADPYDAALRRKAALQ